ncbi:MAG: DUF4238 domain-containing protein [Actinomycetota bacterium]
MTLSTEHTGTAGANEPFDAGISPSSWDGGAAQDLPTVPIYPGEMRAKRHHLIPAFYLRRFVDGNGRLTRFDLRTNEARVLAVDNAAVETDFYTILTDDGPSDAIESRLAQIEGLAAEAMRNIDTRDGPLTDEDITGLANFVAVQLVRGRDFRDRINAVGDSVMKKITLLQSQNPDAVRKHVQETTGEYPSEEALDEILSWMRDGDYTLELHPNEAIRVMLAAGAELVQPLAEMRWHLLAVTDPVFLASDRPITMWAGDPTPPFYGVGLATADEISLPLDPQKCLVITPLDKSPSLGPAHAPVELNRRTIAGAYRYVFGPPADSLRARTSIGFEAT